MCISTPTSIPPVTPGLPVYAPFDKTQNQTNRKIGAYRDSIAVRFARWTEKNPDIINLLLKFALEAKRAGINRFGIAAIVERARWEANFVSKGEESFKISNDFRSLLARLLMQMDSRLEGFFELRELRSVAKASRRAAPDRSLSVPTSLLTTTS